MDLVHLVSARGGAATWQQLRAHCSAHQIWHAQTTGRLRRIKRGWYVLPDTSPEVSAALLGNAVLAGPSAALFHGLPLLAPPPQPVLASGPVDQVVTPLDRTVLDCARLLPGREALAVADAALRTGLSPRDLDRAAAVAGGVAEYVASLADSRAESMVESFVRWGVATMGLGFDLQVGICGVGRVDIVVDGWLVIETDGFAFHADRQAYRNDRRRWSGLTTLGFATLVLTYEDVVRGRTEWLVRDAMSAPSRRPHSPPAA